MSTPNSTSSIQVGDTVQVLHGQHKGAVAIVRGIGACGHETHDTLALELRDRVEPVFVFRFAVLKPSWQLQPVTSRGDAPPATERICRFKAGDRVQVTNTALSTFGRLGEVQARYLDPVNPGAVGGSLPRWYARYAVAFSDGKVGYWAMLWDWELAPFSSEA